MKNKLAFLIATIAVTSVFAGETVCLNAKLKLNTVPTLSCGDVQKICVTGYEQNDEARVDERMTAKSLILTDAGGRSLEMAFGGQTVSHDSDVDTHLGLDFSSKKISASLEIETDYMDYDSRAPITGTFILMDLYRAYKVNGDIKVQRCEYELSK